MTKDEALRLALEALKHGGCPPDCKDGMTDSGGVHPWGEAALIPCPNCKTIAACEKALAQPEPEPVAWGVDWGNAGDSPCVSIIKRLPDGVLEVVAVEYSPKREPLTPEQIENCFQASANADDEVHIRFARAIEAAHGIKGEA